ncbi:MAG: quinone-interacting membrane-bound oxidoreductase complex subunit QmoC [Nitrospirota bacterium]|nr:quinone-interacting membrane-bound oxidoreductase complex subunit QmoC [Nitrospirota bacterium]
MAEAQIIKPDLEFVKRVMDSGGESLKKCYQCATCSVVCNVTPDDKPFPRKEMLQAQWGLKDKLFSNPDIWLCHQCSDCTAYCPRGAKPGEVLGAVRKLSIEHYAFPGFLGKAVGDSKYLLGLLAVPVVIFLTVIGYLGHLKIPEGEIIYAEKFIPVPAIDTIFIAAALFAVMGFFAGVTRYWKDLKSGVEISTNKWQRMVKGPIPIIVLNTIVEFITHKRFKKCEVTKDRSVSHMFVFFGFVGLAITTTWAIVYLYGYEFFGIKTTGLFNFGLSPYPWYDPMKILGSVSGLVLFAGILQVIMNRNKNAEKAGKGSYYDWLFISIILMIVTTGILSYVLRLADVAVLAYPVYFIHLVVVFFLFAYAPFSKMAHMVYRTTALVFAKYSGREDKKY